MPCTVAREDVARCGVEMRFELTWVTCVTWFWVTAQPWASVLLEVHLSNEEVHRSKEYALEK
eukprot:20183-Chlamydomonas_euryale.AAC.3